MSDDCCPHCGDKLPLVRDAFCLTCGQPLDEPPETARTPEEQKAFRSQVEEEARQTIRLFTRLGRFFRGG
jgi:predicted amidophosphoribosyltransferase